MDVAKQLLPRFLFNTFCTLSKAFYLSFVGFERVQNRPTRTTLRMKDFRGDRRYFGKRIFSNGIFVKVTNEYEMCGYIKQILYTLDESNGRQECFLMFHFKETGRWHFKEAEKTNSPSSAELNGCSHFQLQALISLWMSSQFIKTSKWGGEKNIVSIMCSVTYKLHILFCGQRYWDKMSAKFPWSALPHKVRGKLT